MHLKRRVLGVALALSCVAPLAGCAGVDRVLRDHRGTENWTRSSDAFKEIMRNYVHGSHVKISDEELDSQFEAFLTLSDDDVDRFIRDQSCVPPAGTDPSRYYMANATHQRHDPHFATDQPRPVTGTGDGSETLHATFSANMLLERHEIGPKVSFPARAQLEGNTFPDWSSISTGLSDRAHFDEDFDFVESAQADEVFTATSVIDWSQASGELFIAPELEGGVFSPALFAIYLLRPSPGADPSVYLTVSANAAGDPETPYVGIIDQDFDRAEAYGSITGFAFTYLSDTNNLLDYALVMNDAQSLSFELWITTAFPEHTEAPYLTVRTAVLPAVSDKDVESFTDVKAAKLIMMLRKGALMRDLIAAYYPESSELQLWEDIGALHGDPGFKTDLESAGLSLGANLLENSLWLEPPKVEASGSEGAPEFEAKPGMELGCTGNQK